MKLPRRQFLHMAAGAVALPTTSRIARAQTYPTRPVRIVVGFAAGGSADIVARLMGQWLSGRLSQQFVVENRVGAGTNFATEAVAHAAPDGYTLLLVNPANAINTTLYKKLNFDFIRDTAPVAGIFRAPLVMVVNASFPAKTVPQFIAYAKANPGKINMASGGIGATSHVAGEMFKTMAGVNLVHVPYRGEAPVIADLLGDQVQVYFGGVGAIENVRTGNLRGLAVTTTTRLQTLPEIAAVTEFVPGYEASIWYGVAVPKNTPPDIVDKLNKEINAGLADSTMKARVADLGGTVLAGTPADTWLPKTLVRFLIDDHLSVSVPVEYRNGEFYFDWNTDTDENFKKIMLSDKLAMGFGDKNDIVQFQFTEKIDALFSDADQKTGGLGFGAITHYARAGLGGVLDACRAYQGGVLSPANPGRTSTAQPPAPVIPSPARADNRSIGTGYAVDDKGSVVTNRHVIAGCKRFTVRRGEQAVAAELVASDENNDLALVRGNLPGLQAVHFREGKAIRPADAVVVMGYPYAGLLSAAPQVTTGTVTALAGIRDDSRFLQITAPIQPGNSGGPLFDISGNVVGSVVSTLDPLIVAKVMGSLPQNVNFAIKAGIVREFLDSKGIAYLTANSVTKMDPADVSERGVKSVVMVECTR